jgi:methylmalonyl-CoA/ethylmalonyl-CoA epimerase
MSMFEEARPAAARPQEEGAPAHASDCIIGIDHIAVAVPNLVEAVTWYTRTLGFRLVEERRTHGVSTSMVSAVLVAGSAVVVLVQGGCPKSQVSRFIEHFGPGVQHVAFATRDMDAALARLHAAGGKADTSIIEDVGIRQVFLHRDHRSSVRAELIERRGGTFSDHSVQQLFRTFEANDLY